ncbi:MAG TPA: hypothetical protein VJQ82_16500 [Terriglobales bacterium]|nr:hypothetical protein [Terriglobales bacterium]
MPDLTGNLNTFAQAASAPFTAGLAAPQLPPGGSAGGFNTFQFAPPQLTAPSFSSSFNPTAFSGPNTIQPFQAAPPPVTMPVTAPAPPVTQPAGTPNPSGPLAGRKLQWLQLQQMGLPPQTIAQVMGQGGGGQNGIGAAGAAGGQMGSAGQQGTFGKDAADFGMGMALGAAGLLGAGTIGTAAARGYLGDAFGPASLHNADINPGAYGIDASGYGAADFGGDAGGYGAGAEGAGGGYGSDAGGHAGQGSAEGGFVKGGLIKGPKIKSPNRDNVRIPAQTDEFVMNRHATRLFTPAVLHSMNRFAEMMANGKLGVQR